MSELTELTKRYTKCAASLKKIEKGKESGSDSIRLSRYK